MKSKALCAIDLTFPCNSFKKVIWKSKPIMRAKKNSWSSIRKDNFQISRKNVEILLQQVDMNRQLLMLLSFLEHRLLKSLFSNRKSVWELLNLYKEQLMETWRKNLLCRMKSLRTKCMLNLMLKKTLITLHLSTII